MPPIPVAPLSSDRSTEVIVIGAGIIEAMAAEELTAAGLHVTIVDRRGPLQGATSATTALLQYEIDVPLTVLQHHIGAAEVITSQITGRPDFEDCPRIIGIADQFAVAPAPAGSPVHPTPPCSAPGCWP
jgi:hypothetical protein